MNFILWVVLIALVYVALGNTLYILVDSIQRRKLGSLLLLVLGYALAACIVALYSAPYVHSGRHHAQEWSAQAYAAAFVVPVCLWLLAMRASMRSSSWKDTKRQKELSKQVKLHLALVTGAVVFSVPFYWLITTSLKPDERTNMFPPDLIPVQQSSVIFMGEERDVFLLNRDGEQVKVVKITELENDAWEVAPIRGEHRVWTVDRSDLVADLHPVALWSNYSDALKFLPPEYRFGLKPLWNTVYVTGLTILGTILSSSLVAFAFARLRWPGRDVLFVVLLATMMIPPAVTMLPVFLIFRSLGWIDTLKPLWVPALFGSAFNVFLLRQFFMTIPNDLEDAAKIDGCSYFTIYWKIMLPLIKPALAALTIFAFMGSWNNFMGPLIYISSPEKMTLAYALQLFQGAHGGEPAMMMAAATLVMLPVLAVFFFTQRYMIQGVTLTGIKG